MKPGLAGITIGSITISSFTTEELIGLGFEIGGRVVSVASQLNSGTELVIVVSGCQSPLQSVIKVFLSL